MLSKLVRLANVGLFGNGLPNGAIPFGRVTLVYAENGRGKTTLAEILRSCGANRPELTTGRRTLGSANDPKVEFLVQDGGGPKKVVFEGGAWQSQGGSIAVFDAPFVHENVYAGDAVEPDHRKALLDFALGDAAVAAKARVSELNTQAKAASSRRTQTETALRPLASPYSVAEFVKLTPAEGLQDSLARAQTELQIARNADQLRKLRSLQELTTPLDLLPVVLPLAARSFADMDRAADGLVRGHFGRIGTEGLERWVSDGQVHSGSGVCPFCGQRIDGVELLDAYRRYFSQAYDKTKEELDEAARAVAATYGPVAMRTFIETIRTNEERTEAWRPYAELETPVMEEATLQEAFGAIHQQLSALIDQKRRAPTEPLESDRCRAKVQASFAQVESLVDAYNRQVVAANRVVQDFRDGLANGSAAEVQGRIAKLGAQLRLEVTEVAKAVQDHQSASQEYERLNREREAAKEALDRAEDEAPRAYQERMNEILGKFGVGFQIVEFGRSSAGGEPRATYRLKLRDTNVDANGPGFGQVLSEGDKRALALAFFLARIELDPALSSTVVVFDDVLTSFDLNRRTATLQRLCSLTGKYRQLIVMSHDPRGLAELKVVLTRDAGLGESDFQTLQIGRTSGDMSVIETRDLKALCESPYVRDMRRLCDWVDGTSRDSAHDVAQALRSALEGWLHRRYPTAIPLGTTLGSTFPLIRSAQDGTQLSFAKSLLPELEEINTYSRSFHHLGDPNTGGPETSEGELTGFVRRTLALIWGAPTDVL